MTLAPAPSRTVIAPLTVADIDELAAALHHEAVYEFIGGLPTREDFALGLRRALAGPPAHLVGEHWINHGVRLAATGRLIGRVEATVHDDVAEVAFLYSPAVWGQGHATDGLRWLHDHLRRYPQVRSLWGTTHPQNLRSAALLQRAGYVRVEPIGLPPLYTYDDGDCVFRRSLD